MSPHEGAADPLYWSGTTISSDHSFYWHDSWHVLPKQNYYLNKNRKRTEVKTIKKQKKQKQKKNNMNIGSHVEIDDDQRGLCDSFHWSSSVFDHVSQSDGSIFQLSVSQVNQLWSNIHLWFITICQSVNWITSTSKRVVTGWQRTSHAPSRAHQSCFNLDGQLPEVWWHFLQNEIAILVVGLGINYAGNISTTCYFNMKWWFLSSPTYKITRLWHMYWYVVKFCPMLN